MKSKQALPKDDYKYVGPKDAAMGILGVVTDHVLRYKDGVRVKWELKISAYYPPDYKDHPGAIVRVGGFTVRSGGAKPSEKPRSISGAAVEGEK